MNRSGGIQYLLKHGRASTPVVTRTSMPQMKGLKKLASGGPIDDMDKSGPLGANHFYPGANIQASSGGLTDVGFNDMLGQEQKYADGGPINAPLNYGNVPDYIFKPSMLKPEETKFDRYGRPIFESGTFDKRTKEEAPAAPAQAYDPLAALAAQRGSRDGGGGLSRDGGLAGNGTNFTDDQWATVKQMNDEYGMTKNPVNQIGFKAALSVLSPTLAKMLGMWQNPLEAQMDSVTAIQNYQGGQGVNAALQGGYDVGPSVNSRAARDARAAADQAYGAAKAAAEAAPGGFYGGSASAQSGGGAGSSGEGTGAATGGRDTGGGGTDASGGGDRGTRGGFAAGGIAALASGGAPHQGPRMLKGGGDGLSDSIPAVIGKGQPARLADGEFVVSADVVSALGGGSTDAGARKLYAMMDRIRKSAHGTKKQVKKVNENKVLPA